MNTTFLIDSVYGHLPLRYRKVVNREIVAVIVKLTFVRMADALLHCEPIMITGFGMFKPKLQRFENWVSEEVALTLPYMNVYLKMSRLFKGRCSRMIRATPMTRLIRKKSQRGGIRGSKGRESYEEIWVRAGETELE